MHRSTDGAAACWPRACLFACMVSVDQIIPGCLVGHLGIIRAEPLEFEHNDEGTYAVLIGAPQAARAGRARANHEPEMAKGAVDSCVFGVLAKTARFDGLFLRPSEPAIYGRRAPNGRTHQTGERRNGPERPLSELDPF